MSLDAYIELSKKKKDNEKKYLSEIMDQYSETTGNYFKVCYQEVIEWYDEREMIINTYKSILNDLGIDYQNPSCLEVGKGKFDTIFSDDFTTILSPYYKEQSINSLGYILNGKIKVLSPFKKKLKTKLFKAQLLELSDFDITHLITQNIYHTCELENLIQIANLGLADITVGAYGKVYDKNREEQIRNLKKLKEKLTCEYLEKELNQQEAYYYVLTTNSRK